MTDQAINWVSAQQALTPNKPFYLYFATGATHAPHHAPKEWIAKYKGQFKRRLGQAARGHLRPSEEDWALSRPSTQAHAASEGDTGVGRHERARRRRLFERQMETFAGFAAHTDA